MEEPRKAYQATADIAARPEHAWSILTDGSAYPTWGSDVMRVDGRIAPIEKVTVVSEANSGRVSR